MLNLSVSNQPCAPGKKSGSAEPRPLHCATCGAPGGKGGTLLEKHIIGQGRARYLCPLCHCVLHLDVAGKLKAGRIIWLPELTQVQLNLLSLVGFIAIRKAGVHREHEDVKSIADRAKSLYKAFERRSEAVESFLGGGATKSPLPRHALSTPTHLASLIVQAQKESKLDAKTMAQRLDGLRLLPDPRAFDAYIAQVSRIATATFPVTEWMAQASAILTTAQGGQGEAGDAGVAHFDAGAEVSEHRAAQELAE